MNKNIVMFLIIGSSMISIISSKAIDPVDGSPHSYSNSHDKSNNSNLWFNSPNPAGSDPHYLESEGKKAEKVETATNAATGQGK
jgi:hypothetical protein